MRLDIRHWEMLKAIDEAGTVRQAAELLGITQSALSHRLAEAERRLGGKLYERDGRRLRLLPAGQGMTQVANRILPILKRAETDFQQMTKHEAAVVRVGVAAYSCYHWLPRFLTVLEKSAPGIQLELVAAATQNPLQNLREGGVDVVVAPGHLSTAGISDVPLFSDQLVLVVPVGHRFAERRYIEAEDLADQVYLTYSRTSQPGFEYERFIRPSNILPQRINYIEMTDAIVELIASGFGVSILSKWAMSSALRSKRVEVVQLGPAGLALEWSALVRESEPEHSTARVVADLLVEWYTVPAP